LPYKTRHLHDLNSNILFNVSDFRKQQTGIHGVHKLCDGDRGSGGAVHRLHAVRLSRVHQPVSVHQLNCLRFHTPSQVCHSQQTGL